MNKLFRQMYVDPLVIAAKPRKASFQAFQATGQEWQVSIESRCPHCVQTIGEMFKPALALGVHPLALLLLFEQFSQN